eukprot:9494371-Pyramimonas_sp.AAC.1
MNAYVARIKDRHSRRTKLVQVMCPATTTRRCPLTLDLLNNSSNAYRSLHSLCPLTKRKRPALRDTPNNSRSLLAPSTSWTTRPRPLSCLRATFKRLAAAPGSDPKRGSCPRKRQTRAPQEASELLQACRLIPARSC